MTEAEWIASLRARRAALLTQLAAIDKAIALARVGHRSLIVRNDATGCCTCVSIGPAPRAARLRNRPRPRPQCRRP